MKTSFIEFNNNNNNNNNNEMIFNQYPGHSQYIQDHNFITNLTNNLSMIFQTK